MKTGLWGLLHVLLPVPVALDTSLRLSPSPASFPDTKHHHWAKPHELFGMLLNYLRCCPAPGSG